MLTCFVSHRNDPAVSEMTRLQYRFLDMRRGPLHQNIVLRSQVISFIRKEMADMGFLEIQTPILTVSSPEGARLLSPFRVHRQILRAASGTAAVQTAVDDLGF